MVSTNMDSMDTPVDVNKDIINMNMHINIDNASYLHYQLW